MKSVPTHSNRSFTLGQRITLAIVPRLVSALLWLVSRTWRFEVIPPQDAAPIGFDQQAPPLIYCFWHQCVLPCTVYFRKSKTVILISRSFDGELIARILLLFGYGAVRGSSSNNARAGLLGLKSAFARGSGVVFTADGPRGPIYQTKSGPIKLAQITGSPIVCFHLQPDRFWEVNSWDRFLIPKPFARIVVSWGPTTHVPADLAQEEFEAKRQQLNDALESARLQAYEHIKENHGHDRAARC
jgi:lysophospholipid acyltransferase (LPLAT)-like uncharacterized protein